MFCDHSVCCTSCVCALGGASDTPAGCRGRGGFRCRLVCLLHRRISVTSLLILKQGSIISLCGESALVPSPSQNRFSTSGGQSLVRSLDAFGAVSGFEAQSTSRCRLSRSTPWEMFSWITRRVRTVRRFVHTDRSLQEEPAQLSKPTFLKVFCSVVFL